jgi:hypothetical protein
MKKLFFLCFVFFLFISCSGRISGSLAADGSASVSVNISLEPRMTGLLRAVTAASGQAGGPVLDGPAIAQSMSGAPGITRVSLRNISQSSVEGAFQISQISEFLSVAGAERGVSRRGFFTFEQRNSGGRCVININRDSAPEILEILSAEISDYLNALIAPIATGEEMKKQDYLELVASFYGKAISEEIANSRIRVSIDFPGNITTVTGGTFSAKRADFDISLLDLLVLEIPARYEITWE